MAGDPSDVGLTLTISWDPPDVGTPSSYKCPDQRALKLGIPSLLGGTISGARSARRRDRTAAKSSEMPFSTLAFATFGLGRERAMPKDGCEAHAVLPRG